MPGLAREAISKIKFTKTSGKIEAVLGSLNLFKNSLDMGSTSEGCARGYRVCKESGIYGRKPDRRVWRFETLAAAEKEYCRRIRAKTNLQRKSVRKYVLADGGRDFGEKWGSGGNSRIEQPFFCKFSLGSDQAQF